MTLMRNRPTTIEGRMALLILGGAAVLTAGAALPAGGARAVVALPIAAVLPGYAIGAALLGQRRRDEFVTLATSVIISIAFYALGPLLLYAAGIRITTTSVLITVDVVAGSAAAFVLSRARDKRPANWQRVLTAAACTGAAALAVGGAVAATRALAPSPTRAPGFDSISFTGSWARTKTPLAVDGSRLRFGVYVGNHTAKQRLYRVVVSVDGRAWKTRNVGLAKGRSEATRFDGFLPPGGCSRRLVVALYVGSPTRRLTGLTMQLASSARACSSRTGTP